MMDLKIIASFEVITYRKRKIARYKGDKLSFICPRCGHHTYHYAEGGRVRRKECSYCNFDSSFNEYSMSIKTAARRGNLQHIVSQEFYDRVVEYQQSLIKLEKETTT